MDGMANIEIIHSDAVAWANEYAKKIERGEEQPFQTLFCDPPYHLTSVQKRFSDSSIERESFVENNQQKHGMARLAKSLSGFMGKKWDGGDVAFRPETWAAFSSVMHDGAFGMAFASTRGLHRMMVAIEDAGFIIHPVIFLYTFGSGFPKATRIDTQVATSDLARTWAGHRYGLQALKPATEPIVVFQKPYRGKPVENITRTGAGTLNIDGTRIGKETITTQGGDKFKGLGIFGKYHTATESNHTGRWASNFLVAHHPDCQRVGVKKVKGNGHHSYKIPANGGLYELGLNNLEDKGNPYADTDGMETVEAWECVDGCAVKALDEQSGISKSIPHTHDHKQETQIFGNGHGLGIRKGDSQYSDTGGASRFFFNVQTQIDEADPVYYCAKASRSERDAGLSEFPIKLTSAMAGRRDSHDMEGYKIDNDVTERFVTSGRNLHPTVKPLKLTEYLCTLLLPPPEYAPRRIFVPFAGVASECIGAMQAGWEEIIGVELTEEYIPIAQARIKYWQTKMECGESSKPKAKRKSKVTEKPIDKTDSSPSNNEIQLMFEVDG